MSDLLRCCQTLDWYSRDERRLVYEKVIKVKADVAALLYV